MALKICGTILFTWSQFSPNYQANTGKHSCGVDTSLSLFTVLYFHLACFAYLNQKLQVQFLPPSYSPWSQGDRGAMSSQELRFDSRLLEEPAHPEPVFYWDSS